MRRNKKFLLCLIAASGISQASTLPVLTEQQVLMSVKKHYPLVLAAKYDIKKAQGEYLSAKGGFDPSVRSDFLITGVGKYNNRYFNTELSVPVEDSANRFFTGYRIGNGNFPVYDQNRETYDYGEVRAGMELPSLRDTHIDARRAKIAIGKISIRRNEQNLALMQLESQRAASISYWSWYVEGKKFEILKKLLKLSNDRQSMLMHSVKMGNLPAIDQTDNERIILQRRAALEKQDIIFKKSAYMLSLFYRDERGVSVIPELSQLPRALRMYRNAAVSKRGLEHFADQLQEHPQIQKLEAEKNASLVMLKAAQNKMLPVLNHRIYLAQDFGGGNPPLNRTSINYQMVFELPLYQREARGEIMAAQRVLERIDTELSFQHERFMVEFKDAINQIKLSLRIMAMTQKEIKVATEVEKAEWLRFQHGDSDLFLLNQRETVTAQAKIQYLDAVAQYNGALANLRFLTSSLKQL